MTKRKNRGGRPLALIDPSEVHKLAMLGATAKEIGEHLGVSHDTITRRFRAELEAGLAEGGLAAKAKMYKKGVINGEQRALEKYLEHVHGWRDGQAPQNIVNVVNNPGPRRSEAETKAHLVELQKAVLSEAWARWDGPVRGRLLPGRIGQPVGKCLLRGLE